MADSQHPRSSDEDGIAIIGYGCRLPGGLTSPEQLWTALTAGRDLVTDAPESRFDAAQYLDPDPRRPGKTYTVAGGFLDDVEGFDAGFFGISPREASRMDPQQRLLLELTQEALDDAGLDPALLAGSDTGVYAGVSSQDYSTLQLGHPESITSHTMIGVVASNTANRISHLFDLHGPSMAIDTACASSLTALHQACEQLRTGGSRITLAAGVNVLLNPADFVGFAKASMLSPTGHCHTFSAAADGYVRSEGGGVVVLKRLADALADGDRVRAVILATGAGSDGRTAGLSMPNADAQEELVRRVHARAGIDPAKVGYVEAHGTGTPAGDPAECLALGRAIGQYAGTPLPIGSIKSNLGHLEAGAGMAGLVKCVLILEHGSIPPTVHASPLNPAIDFDALGLAPALESVELAADRPIVGINSFGFGGAIAHAALRAAPSRQPTVTPRRLLPFLVSATTEEALTATAGHAARMLGDSTHSYYDLAHTACVRRGHHRERIVVLANDAAEAATKLDEIVVGGATVGTARRSMAEGPIAFAYSGNGSQWLGMGSDLLVSDRSFAEVVGKVDAELRDPLGWSVLAELEQPTRPLHLTEVAQPLLFAVQVGITAILASRGIQPSMVVGHSVGEVAAAYAAGALDLPAACRVIVERSKAQATTAGRGRMAAVGLSSAEAEEAIAKYGDQLEIAAINGPADVTVAGDETALCALGDELLEQSVFFRQLDLDYAFHTKAMDGLEVSLATGLAGLAARPTTIPMISTVTGRSIDGEELGSSYWWRNVREPVLFGPAVAELGCDLVVEIGPRPVLTGYIRRQSGAQIVPTLTLGETGADALSNTCAAVLAASEVANWTQWFPEPGRVVSLPAYPWQHERHFNGTPDWWTRDRGNSRPVHPLLGSRLPCVEPTWSTSIEPARHGWLGDHEVGGAIVVPATAYLELALAAGREQFEGPIEITDLTLPGALVLPWDDPAMEVTLQTSVGANGRLRIASRSGGQQVWQEHATCRVRSLSSGPPSASADVPVTPFRDREQIYQTFERAGFRYGDTFRGLRRLSLTDDGALAEYETSAVLDGYLAHPALVDLGLQANLPLVADLWGAQSFLPESIESVRWWGSPATRGLVFIRPKVSSARYAVFDLVLTDPDGTVRLELTGVRFQRFEAAASTKVLRQHTVLRAAPLPGASYPPVPVSSHDLVARVKHDFDEARYGTFLTEAKQLVARYVTQALDKIGPLTGVPAERHPLLAMLTGLADRLSVDDPPSQAELLDRWPGQAAELRMVMRCGTQLAEILTGEVDAMDLLFADSDRLAEQNYLTSALWQSVNRSARDVLAAVVEQWPADRPLRVLEVGAGTGSTTAWLLPVLPPERTTYAFTDVSAAFLPTAAQRFARYDFVEYRTLDLNAPIEETGCFDLVVAANVLHATADLTASLGAVSQLLAPGGRLLAIEQHDLDMFLAGYGLLDSAWTFTGRSTPVLPRESWPDLLASSGFTDIVQLPTADLCSLLLATTGDTAATTEGASRRDFAVLGGHPLAESTVAALRAAGMNVRTESGEFTDGLNVVLMPFGRGDTESVVDLAAELRGFAKSCYGLPAGTRIRTWLVTSGEGLTPVPDDPFSAAAWALARTLTTENPVYPVRRISTTSVEQLVTELLSETDEDEVVLTPQGRFVPRVVDLPATETRLLTAGDQPYRLEVAESGVNYRLAWTAMELPAPAADEVVIEVRACGLAYRDVAVAQGLVPPMAETPGTRMPLLGPECAGVVTAVGSDVTSVAVGDRVMTGRPGSLASHLSVHARHVLPIPPDLSFEAATTLLINFATVHYGLDWLAGLRAGETVLIQGATGGIGFAALRYADLVGATVIATAGTPAKRDLLRQLGYQHVLDSRGLLFADQVREITGDRGVDIVLNSVAGESATRALELLAPQGRFVELGKRDMLAGHSLPLRPFNGDLSYFGVDITRLLESARGARLATELTQRIEDGSYRPLPYSVYPAAQLSEAMTVLRTSRHIGKVVISCDPGEPLPIEFPAQPPRLDADGTYLVVGGLGGFGAATASWLAAAGARHLALASRRGEDHPEASGVLADLTGRGATATAYQVDIGEPAQVRRLVAAIDRTGHPLRGIIHAPMLVDDEAIPKLTDPRVRSVVAPKLTGAAELDLASRDRALDFFVVYSSISALVGYLTQSSYAAANLAAEAIVRQRRAVGLPGLAVQWGAISDTGYVHRTGGTEVLRRGGYGALTAADGLRALGELLDRADVEVVAVGSMDWTVVSRSVTTVTAPRFSRVVGAGSASAAVDDDLTGRLRCATDAEAQGLVADVLRQALAGVLQTTAERIAPDQRFDQLGLDSLMATELSVVLQRQLDCVIPSVELVNSAGVDQLVPRLLTRLRGGK
ncbi:SDR family NAD(P)-dependent oxidoreductase [Kribbella sp. NPDC056861]|uniref:type I polyketide synthase n=1 Tax=Kribbella sp. NPDC056861 TaxID=3154857 RepID=UPI00341485CD